MGRPKENKRLMKKITIDKLHSFHSRPKIVNTSVIKYYQMVSVENVIQMKVRIVHKILCRKTSGQNTRFGREHVDPMIILKQT